ncbi:MAG: 4-hydroxythreonine-4-phosphate dehydrogenase PdxA [Rhizobiaceae bacterium]
MSGALALTMGEPGGVGAEITIKAWQALHASGPAFFYCGSAALVEAAAHALGLEAPVIRISEPAQARAAFDRGLPVIDFPLKDVVTPGAASPRHAEAVINVIETAVRFAMAGQAAGIVTNPIQKHSLHQAGFLHPGHTEFLQALSGPGSRAVMMLAGGGLRVVPVTIHEALRRAIDRLTPALIIETGLAAARGLQRDFGIAAPRLAVAGLNPHAGENGDMGDEEQTIVTPAIAGLRAQGVDAFGPLSPDTMFTARARGSYDAALCLYHDQALIPLKTLAMDEGVNVTLGLPFVRTSPDHGTALDIAGKGIADPGSLIAALKLAATIAVHRKTKP